MSAGASESAASSGAGTGAGTTGGVSSHCKTVLCFGDSNTFGSHVSADGLRLRHPRHVRWPGVMRKLLNGGDGDDGGAATDASSEVDVVEEGLGGRTTCFDDMSSGVCNRNGYTQLPALLQSHRPLSVVVLALGINDTKGRFDASAEHIAHGMSALVHLVRTSNVGHGYWNADSGGDVKTPNVVIVAPPPMTEKALEVYGGDAEGKGMTVASQEKSLALADAYDALGKRLDCPVVRVASVAEVDPMDGLHFTAEAHAAMGRAIAEAVRPLL